MISSARRWMVWVAGLVLLGSAIATGQQSPSKADLVKQGKAATALVQLRPAPTGTPRDTGFKDDEFRKDDFPKADYRVTSGTIAAFCVHPTGLFVTSEQALSAYGKPGQVSLIVDPGLKTRKLLKAQVVRSDKDRDLALLRVEGAANLPSLALGEADEVAELTELVYLGFPGGARTGLTSSSAASVNTAKVRSLQRQNDVLHRIQLDTPIDRGYVGGPLLDRHGRVVGVLGFSPDGSLVAIPSNQVSQFLTAPDFQFTPPIVTSTNRHEPIAFQARVVSLLPTTDPLTVELRLQSVGQPQRQLKMELKDGVYGVTTAPVPGPKSPPPVRVAIGYEPDKLTGTAPDLDFKVGDRGLKLSEVHSLRGQPKPHVLLATGKTLEGPIAGLDAVPVQFGGDNAVRVNLTRAAEVRIETIANADSVAYTLVATQSGKEVGRLSGTLGLSSFAVAGAPARPGTATLEKTTQALPGPAADVAVGGGGRFLIFHLPSVRQLAIFDAQQAKVVKFLNLAEDDVKFAAGQDKLIVVLPTSNLIQRWDLTTFERETSAPLPVKGTIKALAMGAASRGPLLVMTSPNARDRFGTTFTSIDPATLKPQELGRPEANPFHGDMMQLRASADGRVFGMWSTSHSPSGLGSIVLTGNAMKSHYEHHSVGYILPGPDGKVLFTGSGLWTNDCKPLGELSQEYLGNQCIPAPQGNYYLSLQRPDAQRFAPRFDQQPVERKASLGLYMVGDVRPLVSVPNFPILEGEQQWVRQGLPADKRIHFLPEAKLVVSISPANDQLELYRFDIEELLDRAGVEYLLVQSQPPAVARRGTSFSYQLSVKSKKGGLVYKVESGPPGLAVSPSGKITWQVPERPAEAEAPVIVSIRDAGGQECFHVFTLGLRD